MVTGVMARHEYWRGLSWDSGKREEGVPPMILRGRPRSEAVSMTSPDNR